MADITAATGLTKGVTYGNFENKEEVALADFDHNHARLQAEISKRIAFAQNAQSYR